MRFFAFVIFIAAPFLFASAQTDRQAKIDSLEAVVKQAEGARKAAAYCELCSQYYQAGETDLARETGETGLRLARKSGPESTNAA